MKYLFPVLILSTIFFSSCSIDWNNEKDKKIIALEQQIQNDLFKKKQECSKMSIPIQANQEILDLFYSSERNSCIYRILEWNEQTVWDGYTKEYIFKKSAFWNDDEFFKKLKELKWEFPDNDPLWIR